jgi:hypothetical protein
MEGLEWRDETGPCNGVKEAVDACDSPERPLLCRGSVETYAPFCREDFLSGTDYERDGLIGARYRLG